MRLAYIDDVHRQCDEGLWIFFLLAVIQASSISAGVRASETVDAFADRSPKLPL
jgi:hypothetical protein